MRTLLRMGRMMSTAFTLVSHALCPYVQRCAIVLQEKGISFERRDIDLSNKPDWFLNISPLGKTPVLLVNNDAIFESAVICEYLDETIAPRMHPTSPLERARHRAWMEFGSSQLNTIAAFYNANDEPALVKQATQLRNRFAQLEAVLGDGPYFAGEMFCVVDAVFGPVFRYFDVFDAFTNFSLFEGLPKVSAWRSELAKRDSVRNAVRGDYNDRLRTFLLNRNSALSKRMVL
jgi:glutathione S-transferase